MNIFVLSENPIEAAQYHCDKHCVKMILEHTQMLSTAIRVFSNDSIDSVYKKAHLNHPCSVWARKTRSNFNWLCEITQELFQEYTKRYNKEHKSYYIFDICRNNINIIPEGELTPHSICMPDEYKSDDAVKSYRTYYLKDKKDFAKWKIGNVPSWWNI
jgi:hypothetical protein